MTKVTGKTTKGRYVFIGEEVGVGGASEGKVISKHFTNWGGSNLF